MDDVFNQATDVVSLDELMQILSVDRNRQTLRVLLELEESITLDALVAEVASRERANGASPEPKQIKTMLYHSHLPALADAGLVGYIGTDEWVGLAYTGVPELTPLLTDLLARDEA